MKQATIILIVLGTFITGNPSARADSGNPFGFETNKHPLEYEYCKKAEPKAAQTHYGYECNFAPRIHPDIEAYYLYFVEDVGLCSIHAFSFTGISSLDERKNRVDKFKQQIAKKYGPPTRKTDEESTHGYTYRYDWDQGTGFNGLGDVNAIETFLDDKGNDYFKVYLRFTLVTSDACRKKIDENTYRAF